MANQKIGIVISAKDRTRQAFAKVASAMNVLRKSVFNLKTGIAGLVGAGGFILLARQGLKSIDNIGKLSRTLGLTTEQLGTLQHMANLGGTSLDTFARSVRNLDKGALDFVTKGTGEAKDAFQALGISVEDVSASSHDQMALMGLVADKLNLMENGVAKTGIAMKLFGSRSIEILPALEGGSKAIEGMRREAEELGIVMGKDAVAEVEAANDAIARLTTIFTALRNKVVIAISPALTHIATVLKDHLVKNLELSGNTIQDFVREGISAFLSWVENLLKGLGVVSDKLRGFVKYISGVDLGTLNFQKAIDLIIETRKVMEKLPDTVVAATTPMKNMATTVEVVTEKIKTQNGALAKYAKAAQDTGDALESGAVRGLNKLEDALVNVTDKTFSLKDSFKSMATSIVQDLQRMMIKKAVTGPLSSVLGGLFDSVGGLFSGGDLPDFAPFAKGGPIRAGQAAIVGERGPELFVPQNQGRIVANKDITGGGVSITNSYDFSAANPATIAMLRQESERIKSDTFNSVFDAVNRGGRYARIVGRRA